MKLTFLNLVSTLKMVLKKTAFPSVNLLSNLYLISERSSALRISSIVKKGSILFFLVKNPITIISVDTSNHDTYLSIVSINIYYACGYEAPLIIQSQCKPHSP